MDLITDDLKLFSGDCLERLKELPDSSVDMVLADPPYGTTNCAWDCPIDLKALWAQLNRVVKDTGAILLTAQTPFDKVLGTSNLKALRYEWIWEKGNATGFFNAKKMPLKAHENILVFYRRLPVYNPQKTSGHERKTAGRMGSKSDCYGKEVKKTYYDSTDRYPRSVQRFSSDKQKNSLHPTQKPLALMRYLIETYSNQGDTILDFAMGSGTTGEAAILTGRKFIGVELDPDYYGIACGRIMEAAL